MALKFKATVNLQNNTATIEDISSYTNTIAILKVVDNMGNTIYKNTGYDSGIYTSPDIIKVLDIKKDVSIVNPNTYTVSAKMVSLAEPITLSKLTTIDLATKTITIDGVSTTEKDNILLYGFTKINGIYYYISSYTYVGTTLTLVSDQVTGSSLSTYEIIGFSVDTNELVIKEMRVCYKAANIDIQYTILCDTSQLISTDNSTYIATIKDNLLAAATFIRTHSVSAPIGSSYGVIQDTSDKSRTFNNIWTNTWQTSISTDVTYNVELWDTEYWLVYTDTVKGSDTAVVNCSTCTCEYRQCIINIYQQWIAAPYGKTKDLLERDVLKLTSLYTQYLQAERCGENTYDICTQIVAILGTYNCNCMLQPLDPPSTLVVSIKDVAVGNVIYTDSGVPIISSNINDIYINTDNYDLYQYYTTWTLIGNIKGATGSQGPTGSKGSDGADGIDGKTVVAIHVDLSRDNNTLIQNIIAQTNKITIVSIVGEAINGSNCNIKVSHNSITPTTLITVVNGSTYQTKQEMGYDGFLVGDIINIVVDRGAAIAGSLTIIIIFN